MKREGKTTAHMLAALIRRHGGPEVLDVAEVERPVAKADEVLVRVGACALNYLDIFVRRGMPGIQYDFPHVSGGDVAGWVEAVGSRDAESLVGQTVLIDPDVDDGALGEGRRWGGLAEYVSVPRQNVIPLAGANDLKPYAALPIAYGTAHRMVFTRARLVSEETIAVLGASGGVGVACVQLAHRIGARVIACSASDQKLERLGRLGADHMVNNAREDFSRRIWEITGKKGADVVIDFSGKDTWPGSIRCTKAGGRLATCGATSGFDATTDLRYVWTRELNILGCNGWEREDLMTLLDLVHTEQLQPVISNVYPLSRIREAEAELEERRAFGKVIVVPDQVLNRGN